MLERTPPYQLKQARYIAKLSILIPRNAVCFKWDFIKGGDF